MRQKIYMLTDAQRSNLCKIIDEYLKAGPSITHSEALEVGELMLKFEEPIPEEAPYKCLKQSVIDELFNTVREEIRDSVNELTWDEIENMSLEAIAELMMVGDFDSDPTAEEIQRWIKDNTIS